MSGKMRGLVLTGPGQIETLEIDKPKITASEILVKTKALALCTIEQRAYRGSVKVNYPYLGGHEVSGVIEEIGADVCGFKIGDKVAPTIPFCGYCEACMTAHNTQCSNVRAQKRRLVDDRIAYIGNAGMAEYAAVPVAQVCPVGDNVPFELAAMSEPLGCAIHSVRKTRAQFGETAVVIGAGIMGVLHIKLLCMQGVRVIVSEVFEERRKKALDMGASLIVDPSKEDPVEFVRKVTDGVGADIVVNTTSLPQVWPQVIAMAAPYGRIMAYASQHPNEPIPINPGYVHSKEIEIIGTVNPAPIDFLAATRLMKYGLIDMRDVLHNVYSFDKAKEAFEQAIVAGTYRCVIKFD